MKSDFQTDETEETYIPPKLGVCKYKNIGGITCYINSILHILQHVPIFNEYITKTIFREVLMNKIQDKILINPSIEYQKDKLLNSYVIFELFRLFNASFQREDASITPTSFKLLIGEKNEMWNESNHQDSQEFFTFLISQLQEEVGVKSKFIPGLYFNDTQDIIFDYNIRRITAINTLINFQSREYSPLKNLFDGLMENNRKCVCCGSIVTRYEPFITLGLSIPIKTRMDMDRTFDIYECLDHLIQEEQFDDENKMKCDMCGLKNRSFSGSLLWKTPKILVFHIKRFLVNSYGIPSQKITNNIDYPLYNLDLQKYFNNASPYKHQSKYDLIGVNMHQAFGYGGNINSGHYTSLVKNFINNHWYLYNDSHSVIMAYKKEHLQHKNSYLLFYHRQN